MMYLGIWHDSARLAQGVGVIDFRRRLGNREGLKSPDSEKVVDDR